MKKIEVFSPLPKQWRKKCFRILQIWSVLFVIGLMTAHANVFSQKKIDLKVENATLLAVLDQLQEQSDYTFLFSGEDVRGVRGITFHAVQEDFFDLLNFCLRNTGLEYEVDHSLIVLKKSKVMATDSLLHKAVFVGGSVKDEDGNPLPGVSIKIKRTHHGTATDSEGFYALELPQIEGIILVYSHVGMKTVEVKYNKQQSIHVTMYPEVNEIDEVVVNAGYLQIEKRHLTSAVTTLKAKDVLVPGLNTIDQLLEGHVPGMVFMQNSGQVGAAPRLRIRGTSTVLGNQEPLWVLDGIILTDPVNVDPSQINDLDFVNLLGNAIAGINPSDIEQIDVLKDAAATALYGARAANGVIVITTKRGSIGSPSVSYSFSGGFSQRPHYRDRGVYMMNAAERIDFSREIVEKRLVYPNIGSHVGYEAAIIDHYKGLIDFPTFQKTIRKYEKINADWFGALTQNSFSHDHSLSISGGTERVRYYASLGYTNEQGVLQKEASKRYTANINVTTNYKGFQIYFSLLGNVAEKRYSPEDLRLLNYAYNTSRAVPVYQENGELNFYPKTAAYTSYDFNILHERDHSYQKINGNGITLRTTVDYRFASWLKGGVTLSYSADNTNQDIYHGEKTYYATQLRREGMSDSELPYGGELKKDDTRKSSYILRAQLDFNKFLDAPHKHQIMASVGGEISSTKYKGLRQTHRCYLPDRGDIFNAVDISAYPNYGRWLATDPEALGVLKNDLSNLASGFATLSYSYVDKYIFNINARIDGSNEFGSKANDKLLPIWSLSGRWNIAQDVLKNVHWVDDLALRVSMGIQGNMLKTVSSELVIEKGGLNTAFNKYQSTVKYFPNRDLKWEKTKSYNIGLDFAFLNNRIRGTVSYFYKQTKDAFLEKTISEVNGINRYVVNKGTLRNQGFDLVMNFNPISSEKGRNGFSWRIDPQIGQVLNQLIDRKLNRDKALHDEITYSDYLEGRVEVAGRPLNTFYSYKFAGLDPKDGRPRFYNIDEYEGEGDNRESIADKYSRMTKDEVFLAVMEHSGTRVPVIQGGISNTFSYKGFVLNFNLTYSLGSKIRLLKMYSNLGGYGTLAPQPIDNVRKEFIHRWRRPGDELHTQIPGLISNKEYRKTLEPWWYNKTYQFAQNIWQMYDESDIRVVSGNYLKLQSLSLRYVFPEKICKSLLLKSAYVSFSGSNLFTLSAKELRGQEPTQSGSSDNINLSVRPHYSFSLNISF